MKTIKFFSVYCIALIFSNISLYAQNDSIAKDVVTYAEFPEIKYSVLRKPVDKSITGMSIFQDNIYPAEQRLINYINDYFVYTKSPEKDGMDGNVTVNLYFSETGKIYKTAIANSSGCEVCDSFAMQIVRLMPDWKPATKNGINVKSRQPLTFVFKLPPLDLIESVGIKAGILTDSGNFIDYEEYNDSITGVDACLIGNGKNTEYKGGIMALYKFISNNLRYPAVAQENGWQGRPTIRFLVSETGKVGSVEILRSCGYDILDFEAARVIFTLPDCIPAFFDGKNVKSVWTIPITFKQFP
ncbi:hypothetical protein FACS189429_3240 [Bacteroidia bacterium]|nr:hypothetical protein FACS189429_3240 [Bacteroidia bacterium]GHV45050.1 hypothetical protein FACS1894180_7150 [Bacteroidia bacterium]